MQCKPQFTTTLVVMSVESNACSVFVSQVCLRTTYIRVGPCDQLNAKDIDMEKALLSYESASEIMRFTHRPSRPMPFFKVGVLN